MDPRMRMLSATLLVGVGLISCVSASDGNHTTTAEGTVTKEALLSELVYADIELEAATIEKLLRQLEEIGGPTALCEGLKTIGVSAIVDNDSWTAVKYLKRALATCDDKGAVVYRLAQVTKDDHGLCVELKNTIQSVNKALESSFAGRLGRAQMSMLCGETEAQSEDLEWLTSQRSIEIIGPKSKYNDSYARDVILSYLSSEIKNYSDADAHLGRAAAALCKSSIGLDSQIAIVRKELRNSVNYGFQLDALWVLDRVVKTDAIYTLTNDEANCLRLMASNLEDAFRAAGQEKDGKLAEQSAWIKNRLIDNLTKLGVESGDLEK